MQHIIRDSSPFLLEKLLTPSGPKTLIIDSIIIDPENHQPINSSDLIKLLGQSCLEHVTRKYSKQGLVSNPRLASALVTKFKQIIMELDSLSLPENTRSFLYINHYV